MQEMYYGAREPAYFVQYAEQTSRPRSQAYQIPVSMFDLMVPMCCARCVDQVRDALLAMGGVLDVLCDPRNQRVTVTGCVEPAQALKQVRRVQNGATSSPYMQQSNNISRSYVQRSQNNGTSSPYVQESDNSGTYLQTSQYNNGDAYSWSLCPAYRDTTETHYMSVNPTVAIRVENDC